MMGLPWFRQGEIIETATRECETRQDWGNPVEETKLVNANANTTSGVKVTVGKGFRFGKARATATEATFA